MRRLLIKLLFKLLTTFPQGSEKMSPERELKAFMLDNSENSKDLLKTIVTVQMKRYWNYPNDINKAMGMFAKEMLDSHRAAMYIVNKEKNPSKQLAMWKKTRTYK